MKEILTERAEVTTAQKSYIIRSQRFPSILNEFNATEISVVSGEKILWTKNVLPYSRRTVVPIPVPFYKQRVEWNKRQAKKVAESANSL